MKKRPLVKLYNIRYSFFRFISKKWQSKNLSNVKENQIKKILKKKIKDPISFVRFACISEIRKRNQISLIKELNAQLEREKCWRIKWFLVIVLGEFGSNIDNKTQLKKTIKLLLKIYDDDKKINWLRIRVVESIGKIGLNIENSNLKKEDVINWLIDKLDNDPDWRVKRAAALALGKITKYEESVFDPLISILKGENEKKRKVREQAGFSLGLIGSKSDDLILPHIKSILNILEKKGEDDLIKQHAHLH